MSSSTTSSVDPNNNNHIMFARKASLRSSKTFEPTEFESILEAFAKLSEDDLVRGETPTDIERQCLSLCQAYIGGSWDNARSIEEINFKRITGGLTNQLYKVELKESVQRVRNPMYPEEPSAVAIKLYMSKHMSNSDAVREGGDERLTDTIVLTILSEMGFGPRVYGIFDGGFIQHYLPHDQFNPTLQQCQDLARQVAQVLARVHHLDVPIRKHKTVWILDDIERFLEEAYQVNPVDKLIAELGLKKLQKYPVKEEFKKLVKIVERLQSPFVFSHCDFRSMNILITKSDREVKLVDLEYAAYSPRAYDLATLLTEWGKDALDFRSMGVPPEGPMRQFIQHYIAECDRLEPGYSSDPKNSLEVLVKETKVLTLLRFLFFLSFFMKTTESIIAAVPFDLKNNMKQVEDCYEKYFEVKRQLIQEGLIEDN